jgi:hypothetical protein
MIDEVFCLLLTIVVLCASTVTRPRKATCPPSWHHGGGGGGPGGGGGGRGFACRRDFRTGDLDERPLPGAIAGRVYCTGGASPIVIDHRTVGCQR